MTTTSTNWIVLFLIRIIISLQYNNILTDQYLSSMLVSAAPASSSGSSHHHSNSHAAEWKFNVDVYNKETRQGIWNFLDEDENERTRHAIIGDVYIRKHAPANGTILDIGCATGTLSDYILTSQAYEGYDIGEEAIKKGKLKRPTINLNCQSAEKIVPQNTFYDVIVFNEMLYFVDAKAILQKYLPYLRPKTGFVMISLFKFLNMKHGKSNAQNEKDRARENILAIAHSMYRKVNEIEVIGTTLDGKASWLIQMLRPTDELK